MEKVMAFFTNVWFRRAISALTIGYAIFVGWVIWLAGAFYLKPTNGYSLFALYLFINVLFGAAMIFTRKNLITQIVSIFMPFFGFVLVILGFDQWFMVVPPVAVSIVCFFAAKTGETLKTVLGTIYLIMYIVGVLVFITLRSFSINVSLQLFTRDTEIDVSTRQSDYILSEDGSYRVVSYMDKESSERHTVSYFVEYTGNDIHVPFLVAEQYLSCSHIITTTVENKPSIKWIDNDSLTVDGKVKDFADGELVVEKEEDDDEEYTTTTAASVTKAETTTPAATAE